MNDCLLIQINIKHVKSKFFSLPTTSNDEWGPLFMNMEEWLLEIRQIKQKPNYQLICNMQMDNINAHQKNKHYFVVKSLHHHLPPHSQQLQPSSGAQVDIPWEKGTNSHSRHLPKIKSQTTDPLKHTKDQ